MEALTKVQEASFRETALENSLQYAMYMARESKPLDAEEILDLAAKFSLFVLNGTGSKDTV